MDVMSKLVEAWFCALAVAVLGNAAVAVANAVVVVFGRCCEAAN